MPTNKKTPSKKAAPKTQKKAATKKVTAKQAVKTTVAKKPAPANKKIVAYKVSAKKSPPKSLQKAVVSREGAAADKKSTPIVFSIDDIEELMAAKRSNTSAEEAAPKEAVEKPKVQPAKKVVVDDKPVEKRVLGAASLADILGFNPAEKKKITELDDSELPKKFNKYYGLLIELRAHVSDEISLHTSDTLKHSSHDASNDLSDQTDSGTDSFDRDFALSLVSSEQDALNEIEAAIVRIKNGSYGICEITGKMIPAARLTAVPFARYSVEGQAEHEKNQHRKNNRIAAGGIFGDVTDVPKLESSDDDDE